MSVKVVQGLIKEAKTNFAKSPANFQSNNSITNQANAAATVVASSAFASSEAVSVSVRSLRSTSNPDRIKDPQEAQDVAEKVAEDVRNDKESVDVHGTLTAAHGAPHLT